MRLNTATTTLAIATTVVTPSTSYQPSRVDGRQPGEHHGQGHRGERADHRDTELLPRAAGLAPDLGHPTEHEQGDAAYRHARAHRRHRVGELVGQ